MSELRHLRADDGSWEKFELEWRAACRAFGEDFDDYARDALPVLQQLIDESPAADRARVCAVYIAGRHEVVCQANRALLPGYDGEVLRVRHLVLSPRHDFGDASVEEYAVALSKLLEGIVRLSETEMEAPHIKFHFRSPYDRQFFDNLRRTLEERRAFKQIKLRGMWLYITKR